MSIRLSKAVSDIILVVFISHVSTDAGMRTPEYKARGMYCCKIPDLFYQRQCVEV